MNPTSSADASLRFLALRCIESDRQMYASGDIDLPTYRRFLRLHRRIAHDNLTAPSRLATEGRALPYMGRRRWGQEMTPAR